jgi:hypothetical protein
MSSVMMESAIRIIILAFDVMEFTEYLPLPSKSLDQCLEKPVERWIIIVWSDVGAYSFDKIDSIWFDMEEHLICLDGYTSP